QDLLAETVYTLTLLPKLVSESGSPLSEAFVLSFTTGTSRFSAETFLRHRGDFTDNYTNSPNITLLLSSANENSLRYQVTDQSVAPSSAGSGWQTPLGYPVEVPFKLSESNSGSSTTLTAWFDDGEELVEQVSLGLVYDSVSPSGQLEFAQSSTRDAEVGITLSASDQLSPIAWYLLKLDNLTPALDAEDWIPLENGSLEAVIGLTREIDNSQERTLPLYGWVLDAAGNLSEVFSDQVLIDLSAPEASLALELEPYLNTESLRLELKVEDNSGGELFYLLSKDEQAPEVVDARWQAYLVGEPIEWDLSGEKEGTLNFYLWIRDQAGNLAQRVELHTVIDRTPPTITELLVDGGDNYTNSKEIELSWLAVDNLSGVAEFYLAEIADTPPEASAWLDYDPAKESYPYTLTNTSNGQKSITLFVRDQAGNIAQQTASITFDNLGPAAAVGTLPTYFNGDTLNVSLSVDEVMAEARSYWLSSTNQSPDNNSNWIAFSGSDLTLTLDFSASNGLQQRFLWLKDYLGNTSGPTILETTIDRLGPQISQLQLNGGAAYTNSSTLSLNWTATDDISGVAGFMVSNSSASPASWNTISAGTHSTSFTLSNLQQGSKTLYLHVQDQAKNTSTSTASIIFDIQTPVGFLTLPHTTNQASLPFLVMAFDNLSGAQSYQIQPAATTAPIDSNWTARNGVVYLLKNCWASSMEPLIPARMPTKSLISPVMIRVLPASTISAPCCQTGTIKPLPLPTSTTPAHRSSGSGSETKQAIPGNPRSSWRFALTIRALILARLCYPWTTAAYRLLITT
ncbi:MAG: hypothetical protein EB168_08335, partial [Euryarchaeota archaeon]|nr:hypothetical protein [Euryarchaeota archaeon]